jgi:hypothetical protein
VWAFPDSPYQQHSQRQGAHPILLDLWRQPTFSNYEVGNLIEVMLGHMLSKKLCKCKEKRNLHSATALPQLQDVDLQLPWAVRDVPSGKCFERFLRAPSAFPVRRISAPITLRGNTDNSTP